MLGAARSSDRYWLRARKGFVAVVRCWLAGGRPPAPPALRRVMAGVALAAVAGLGVAGCSTVKMGSAAIVGNQRVTMANLDTEAGMLAAAGKHYPSVFSLTPVEVTQATLSWLIRFRINDQLASDAGITVNGNDGTKALKDIQTEIEQSNPSAGQVSLTEIMVANGLAPNMVDDLGRYQAIELTFIRNQNGGQLPAANSAAATDSQNKLNLAQCQAAKSLDIKVNPQFGQLDYTKYQVVTAPDKVSRPSGAKPSAAPSGQAPAC